MQNVRARRAPEIKPHLNRNPGSANAHTPEKEGGTGGDLHDVYHRLREDILKGSVAPGEVLNQVHIAKTHGVSRTPVREALRLLQAEGLVEAQFQHRTRVTKVTPEEVDAVYASWIVMQSLGVALTVSLLERIRGLELLVRSLRAQLPHPIC